MHGPSDSRRTGALIAIGGNEGRTHELEVLTQTLRAADTGPDGTRRVAVLTAASAEPQRQWQTYRQAFTALDADAQWLDLRTRADAQGHECLQAIEAAQLVFMTGGDQERLARLLNGSAAHRLLMHRQRGQGLAIAGTSAGASVLGTLMPGGGASEDSPTVLDLSDHPIPHGLGLLRGVVIDQHFTQRRRLARLLDLASRQGGLLGMGIDEDTAAVIRPGASLTVVGSGSVTLVDCRRAQRRGVGQPRVSLCNVALHRVRSGASLDAKPGLDPRDFAAFMP